MAFQNLFRDTIASTDYGENAKAVIAKSLKYEESVRDLMHRQREFVESVVEWSSSKEDNDVLVQLGKHFADISLDWTKSHDHFMECFVKVRNEFEVLKNYYRDKVTYETKYLKAEKRFMALERYTNSDNAKKRSKALKAAAIRDRRKQELDSYNTDRHLGTMIKAKYTMTQLAQGYMYLGGAAQKIYSQFEQEIERKISIPHSETHLAVVEHFTSRRSSRQTSNATTPAISRAPSRPDSSSSRSTLPNNSPNQANERYTRVETVNHSDSQKSSSSFDDARVEYNWDNYDSLSSYSDVSLSDIAITPTATTSLLNNQVMEFRDYRTPIVEQKQFVGPTHPLFGPGLLPP